jgi:hypothetical protein
VQIEARVTEFCEHAEPKWHPHFDAACAGDIAEVDNIAGFPTEPLVETG